MALCAQISLEFENANRNVFVLFFPHLGFIYMLHRSWRACRLAQISQYNDGPVSSASCVHMIWKSVRVTTRSSLTAGMADRTPKEGNAPFATRIDPTKEGLSQDQLHYIRQVELEQWKKKTQKLRTRNVVTGLAIGALVLGICILAMYANVNTRWTM